MGWNCWGLRTPAVPFVGSLSPACALGAPTCPPGWRVFIIYRVVENGSRSPIRAGLAGRRVLVTGVTGFLGTALFERLVADFPETRIVVMIRSRYGSPPRARLEELAGRPVFNAFRDRLGG